MNTETYVGRLESLGQKILTTGCEKFAENQKIKSDCEKVGLKMMSVVKNRLLKKVIRNYNNLTPEEKKNKIKLLFSNNNSKAYKKILKDSKIKESDIDSISNNEKIIQETNKIMISLENIDKLEACYRLFELLYEINNKSQYNLDILVREQVYNLFGKILLSESIETINSNDMYFTEQYGGDFGIGIAFLVVIGIIALIMLVPSGDDNTKHDEEKKKNEENLQEFRIFMPETLREWMKRKKNEIKIKNKKLNNKELTKLYKKIKRF